MQNTVKKITIVDDSEDILEILKHMISMYDSDVEVTQFTCPIEARTFIKDNKPDLLITDFNMPHINGDQLSQGVREFHPDLQIILCTGTLDTPEFDYFTIFEKCALVGQQDEFNIILEKILKNL